MSSADPAGASGHRGTQRPLTGGAALAAFALTDTGRQRDHNEDSVFVDEKLGLAVVADGLGGHNAGEVASAIVTQVLEQQVRRRLLAIGGESLNAVATEPATLQMILTSALVDAHAQVLESARNAAGQRGMASTVVALFVHGGTGVLAWVGDSTAFVVRRGALSPPLTRRHNLGTALGRAMAPKGDGARSALLTRVVGGAETLFEPEVITFDVQAGDVYVLCSDGVTDMLDEARLERTLRHAATDLEHAAREVVAAANKAGGEDNISVALLRVDRAPKAFGGTAQEGAGLHSPGGWWTRAPAGMLAGAAVAAVVAGATGGWIARGQLERGARGDGAPAAAATDAERATPSSRASQAVRNPGVEPNGAAGAAVPPASMPSPADPRGDASAMGAKETTPAESSRETADSAQPAAQGSTGTAGHAQRLAKPSPEAEAARDESSLELKTEASAGRRAARSPGADTAGVSKPQGSIGQADARVPPRPDRSPAGRPHPGAEEQKPTGAAQRVKDGHGTAPRPATPGPGPSSAKRDGGPASAP